MNLRHIIKLFSIGFAFIFVSSCTNSSEADFSKKTKVALRDVGHQLLLIHKDSTSLVKPITNVETHKYHLSFEQHLSIDPETLVTLIKANFQKVSLPAYYLVEVLQCKDGEVAYSYQITKTIENGIIPCRGRYLPKSCYYIEVEFTQEILPASDATVVYVLLLIGLILLVAVVLYRLKRSAVADTAAEIDTAYTFIGTYKFYPEQNKLIKEATEVSLSKKECELLSIFIARPNQIIKRDELTKQVWEDHGVIVGRSLDTYISKLRKKLKDDDTIKLSNIHGVGYKLEV